MSIWTQDEYVLFLKVRDALYSLTFSWALESSFRHHLLTTYYLLFYVTLAIRTVPTYSRILFYFNLQKQKRLVFYNYA